MKKGGEKNQISRLIPLSFIHWKMKICFWVAIASHWLQLQLLQPFSFLIELFSTLIHLRHNRCKNIGVKSNHESNSFSTHSSFLSLSHTHKTLFRSPPLSVALSHTPSLLSPTHNTLFLSFSLSPSLFFSLPLCCSLSLTNPLSLTHTNTLSYPLSIFLSLSLTLSPISFHYLIKHTATSFFQRSICYSDRNDQRPDVPRIPRLLWSASHYLALSAFAWLRR